MLLIRFLKLRCSTINNYRRTKLQWVKLIRPNRNASSFSLASKCIIRWLSSLWHLTSQIQGSSRWLAILAMNTRIWLPSETSSTMDSTSLHSSLSTMSERCGLTTETSTRMTKKSRIGSPRSRSTSIKSSNSLTLKIRPWWRHLLQFSNSPLLHQLHLPDKFLLPEELPLKLLNRRHLECKITRRPIRFSKNLTE